MYVEKRTENIGVYQISKRNKKKAGTGPNRPHIQGSKIAKRLPSVKYSFLQYSKIENFSKKLHTQKMDRVARRGLLARAPGALKSHNAEKTERGDPLGFFNIHSVAKHQKNAGGDPLRKKFFSKKNSQCRKKMKGGPFGLARYDMLRGKTGKTFLVQFAGPNSAIWCNNIL